MCTKKNHWNRVTFALKPGDFARHRKMAKLRGIGLLMKKIDYYFQLTVSYDMSLRKIICSFH